jgi:hypothetical protein
MSAGHIIIRSARLLPVYASIAVGSAAAVLLFVIVDGVFEIAAAETGIETLFLACTVISGSVALGLTLISLVRLRHAEVWLSAEIAAIKVALSVMRQVGMVISSEHLEKGLEGRKKNRDSRKAEKVE